MFNVKLMNKGALTHYKAGFLQHAKNLLPASNNRILIVPSTVSTVRRQQRFITLQQKGVTVTACDTKWRKDTLGQGTFEAPFDP